MAYLWFMTRTDGSSPRWWIGVVSDYGWCFFGVVEGGTWPGFYDIDVLCDSA